MKVIFLGGFFPKQFKSQILNDSKRQVQNAANNFQWGFIKGLQENLETRIYLLTAPFIGWFPVFYKKIFLKGRSFQASETETCIMVGFLNLPIIKNIYKVINLKKQLQKTISSAEKTVVIIYSLDTAYLRSAIQLKTQFPKLKICVIITDLHEFPVDSSLFYSLYIKFYKKPIFYKLLNDIDCFVLLSDKMADYLKITKPWVRVEGLYAVNESDIFTESTGKVNQKIILYTGTLDFKYGIRELLSAFNLIEDESFALWICGGGPGKGIVEKASCKDSRISYFGIVDSDKIYELQISASLLVNPRNTIGEYNKYSFPSKTMEYLASGTPALLYRLDGIPAEYFDYCFTVEDNEVQTLSNAMKEVCNLDPITLANKGLEAKKFILNQKTSKIQCKKVVAMLERLV